MQTAERNRAIKRVLEQGFGRGKVRVRGGRGTAYGWVQVSIDYAPRDRDEWRELYQLVHRLIAAAGIKLSTYYGDDGSSDAHSCINIDFARRDAA